MFQIYYKKVDKRYFFWENKGCDPSGITNLTGRNRG